jgi:histidyl-tRNA synthetase
VSAQCREDYVVALRDYLHEHELSLCDEHRKLWSNNPLRVLDCKDPQCVKVTSEGPLLINHICDDCRLHFDRVTSGLTSLGIAWELSPRLVRGFDYYTRTTFEFASEALDAAQNAIGGGGRYDRLAEELGGEPTSGIGFGSGIERLLLAREKEGASGTLLDRSMEVFVVDTTGGDQATLIVDELRRHGIAADRAYDDRSMKAQMKNADRSGARLALLVGSQEAANGTVTIRDLRNADAEQRQWEYPLAELLSAVRASLTESI